MGTITTGSNPKLLWEGLNAIWGDTYDEHSMQCLALFDTKQSSKSYEEVQELITFGLAPKKEQGTALQYDTQSQGFTNRYTNDAYALGFIITHEEFKDNLYFDAGERRAKMLAFSMRTTKEIVGANIYNRAFNDAYTYADGVELLSTLHVTADGTQSNELAVAADLSEASLEDMSIQINNATNSRGLNVAYKPSKLIIPTALEFEAARILKSVLQNDTANNAINALRATGAYSGGVEVNNYLTDTDAWFVRTTCPEGMTMFERESIAFDRDNDFDTKNAKYSAYERYSFGASDWRGLYGSPGA
jgi:hypothetical protein